MTVDISPERLGRHVEVLTERGPRFRDCPGVAPALRHIHTEMTSYGYKVSVERFGSELHEVNLVAEHPGPPASGHGPTDQVVELCAHWDSVEESPGADDNASGVAGVLEAARVLALTSRDSQHALRFCFFGEEEPGMLGSTAHVELLSRGGGRVDAFIFEMIGFVSGSQSFPAELAGLVEVPERGDFIGVVAEPGSIGLLEAFVSAAVDVPTFSLVIPDILLNTVARSDHVPYWRAGHRALMLTDTAEFRNPHYHEETDVARTLDLDFAAKVTTAAVLALTGDLP
jgi:Zn-dependent M28 family amino/carboxypeptidase